MRRRQEFAERFAPHHIGAIGHIEPVGRIGLAALELQDDQRSLVALDVLRKPAVETDLVDPMPFLDRLGAGKFLVFSDAVGHRGAPFLLAHDPYRKTGTHFSGIMRGSSSGSSLLMGRSV